MLCDCLSSLQEHAPKKGARIWVVDNASGDRTAEMARMEFLEVELIVLSENLDFSEANNRAIRRGRAPYVLALNPDAVMLENALDHMLELMERNPQIGVSGYRLELPDGTFDHASRRPFQPPGGRRTPRASCKARGTGSCWQRWSSTVLRSGRAR